MPYKDPEKRREADRRWREANLEKARAREAAYRAANREARRAYRASQKDATRLHACEATFLQTPEGRAPWPDCWRRPATAKPPTSDRDHPPYLGVKLPDGETTKARVRRPSSPRLITRRLGLKGETP
jgi:hypothetical protein